MKTGLYPGGWEHSLQWPRQGGYAEADSYFRLKVYARNGNDVYEVVGKSVISVCKNVKRPKRAN